MPHTFRSIKLDDETVAEGDRGDQGTVFEKLPTVGDTRARSVGITLPAQAFRMSTHRVPPPVKYGRASRSSESSAKG